jgi:hypothetical protein
MLTADPRVETEQQQRQHQVTGVRAVHLARIVGQVPAVRLGRETEARCQPRLYVASADCPRERIQRKPEQHRLQQCDHVRADLEREMQNAVEQRGQPVHRRAERVDVSVGVQEIVLVPAGIGEEVAEEDGAVVGGGIGQHDAEVAGQKHCSYEQ